MADAGSAPDAHVDAAPPLSFAADVYPIIALRCTACHTPTGSGVLEGHLDMTSGAASGAYGRLVNVNAMGTQTGGAGVTCAQSGLVRVVPGSALTSLLYEKVNSKLQNMPAPCGNPMPQPDTATALTTAQVGTIMEWIDEGANP